MKKLDTKFERFARILFSKYGIYLSRIYKETRGFTKTCYANMLLILDKKTRFLKPIIMANPALLKRKAFLCIFRSGQQCREARLTLERRIERLSIEKRRLRSKQPVNVHLLHPRLCGTEALAIKIGKKRGGEFPKWGHPWSHKSMLLDAPCHDSGWRELHAVGRHLGPRARHRSYRCS